MEQGSLFDWRGDDAESRFRSFHEKHPEVYAHLVDLCRRWRRNGRDRWSINGCFEVLRWERRIAGLPDPDEEWKLNNNYRSRYARLLMEQEPELEGIFELRVLKT